MSACANCQQPLAENANYCWNCGQSTKELRQPFWQFSRDSMHELLDIDGRLLLTIKTLLFKPGLASLEFAQGKMVKYTPPLRLYLVVSLLFFLVLGSFNTILPEGELRSQSTTETYSRIMFVLFPVFAIYVGVFFRRSYFLANLVFSMHLHTIAYLALLVIGSLEAMEQRSHLFVLLQVFPGAYFLWYVLTAFKTMFQESILSTMLKSGAIYFVYMATLGLVFDVILG